MNNCKYSIISASTRVNSQSKKVADFIYKHLLKDAQSTNDLLNVIDFAVDSFPLWDESIWEIGINWDPQWALISRKLQASEALIIVVPEWNGMIPPQLTNFFQLCSNQELSHKPALIVSISSGSGGTYPVTELRISSFKNTKICYLPDHVIIRNVSKTMNHAEPESAEDSYIRERLSHSLELLTVYANAFREIRRHDIVQNPKYPYGM